VRTCPDPLTEAIAARDLPVIWPESVTTARLLLRPPVDADASAVFEPRDCFCYARVRYTTTS